ncbi:MAG: hypothetical protein ACI82F_002419 [Planctomycetota bacterium]
MSAGLVPHVGLFLILALVIVVCGAFYAEPDDSIALRSLPRRYMVFVLSCAVVAGLMLLAETFFAGV